SDWRNGVDSFYEQPPASSPKIRPQTADSNRLTVDLGDVEPRARLQQAIEVEEEIALALELEVDSIVGEDARANPLLKLAGQKYNGAKPPNPPFRHVQKRVSLRNGTRFASFTSPAAGSWSPRQIAESRSG